MGLYDSYRLSQSQLVRQPAGSAISDYVKVASTLQDRYDTALNISDELDRQLQNAPVRAEDMPAFEQMKQKYKAGIGEIAKRGDYENALRPLGNLAKNFTGEYSNFANQIAKEQAYDKQLQEYFEKGIIKDANNMARYKAASKKMSTGLQLDPTTGRYVGGFSGMQPAKELDYNDVTNKLLQHINADSNFRASLGISGDYHMKSTEDIERLGPEKIQQAFAAYASVDPEYKGYVQSMQKLRMAEIPDNALDRMPEDKQMEIRNRAIDMGMTGDQYLKLSAAQDEATNIFKGLVGMGMKAAYEKRKDDLDFGPLTESARAKDKDDEMLTTLPGNLGIGIGEAQSVLKGGKAEASGWERFANATGLNKLFSSFSEDGEGAVRQDAMVKRIQAEGKAKGWSNATINQKAKEAISKQNNILSLPNGTRVNQIQYDIVKPMADDYKKKGYSEADAFTAAQEDIQQRAGFNVGVENIRSKKQLQEFEAIKKSSAMFNTMPIQIRDDQGNWEKKSGINAALKDKVKNYTTEQLREALSIAGTVKSGNPLTPGGLALSIPVDRKDPNAGSIDLIAEIDPTVYQGQSQGLSSHIIHNITKQYYGMKNKGTVGTLKWEYNRETGKFDITNDKGKVESVNAPVVAQ